MSRNHQRQKVPKSALKLKVGRAARRVKTPTPSPDASGDEGYSELENLSDSDEEDEDNVQAAEREYILKEVKKGLRFPGDGDSSRPPYDEDDDDGDDEDDGVEDELDEDAEEDDDEDDEDDDESSWNGFESSNDVEVAANQQALEFAAIHGELSSSQTQPGRKAVRFIGVPDASSDEDTETDDEDQDLVDRFFPDIFVDPDTLPSQFRREMARDDGNLMTDSFGPSLDDFGAAQDYSTAESDPEAHLRSYGADTPLNTPITGTNSPFMFPVSMPDQVRVQEPELEDGYETECDSTTEEDEPGPTPLKLKTRRPDPLEDVSDSDKSPVRTPTNGGKSKPRVGHFSLDKSGKKPVAVLDPSTKRMLIFTVHEHRGLDLSPEHFHHEWQKNLAPINMNSMMLLNATFTQSPFEGLMTDPVIDLDQNALLGSALVPSNGIGDDPFGATLLLGPDSDGEQNLDISNFIKEGPQDTDDETDARPSTAGASDAEMETPSGEEGVMPALFDPVQMAAAWPLSLDEAQLLALDDAHLLDVVVELDEDSKGEEERDDADEYADNTAITDVVDLVPTAPMPPAPQTPVLNSPRRRRDSMIMGPPSSPIESVLQKRKSISEHEPAHKRHRSISDMAQLTV